MPSLSSGSRSSGSGKIDGTEGSPDAKGVRASEAYMSLEFAGTALTSAAQFAASSGLLHILNGGIGFEGGAAAFSIG